MSCDETGGGQGGQRLDHHGVELLEHTRLEGVGHAPLLLHAHQYDLESLSDETLAVQGFGGLGGVRHGVKQGRRKGEKKLRGRWGGREGGWEGAREEAEGKGEAEAGGREKKAKGPGGGSTANGAEDTSVSVYGA